MANTDKQSVEHTMRSIHHVKDFTGEEALELMVLAPSLFHELVTDEEEKTINEACSLFLDLIYNVNKVGSTPSSNNKQYLRKPDFCTASSFKGQRRPVGGKGSRFWKKSSRPI